MADITLIFDADKVQSKSNVKKTLDDILKSLNDNPGKIVLDVNKAKTASNIKSAISSIIERQKYSITISSVKLSGAAKSELKNQVKSAIEGTTISLPTKDISRLIAGKTSAKSSSKKDSTIAAFNEEQAALAASYKLIGQQISKVNSQFVSALGKGSDIDGTIKKLEEAKTLYEKMDVARQRLNARKKEQILGEEDINTIRQMEQEYERLVGEIKEAQTAEAEQSKSEQAEKKFATLKKTIALYNQMESYLKRNSKLAGSMQAQEIRSMMDVLGEGIKNSNGKYSTVKDSVLNDYSRAFSSIRAEMRATGQEGQTFGEKIKKMYLKFGGWSLITMSMMKMRQVIRDAVKDVIDIDTAMTELKRVTNESDSTYQTFLQNASGRARTVGSSIKEVVNATADFARLGYSMEDATKLADVAIMYKNVGDGIQDVGEATQSIISTMQAFKMETDDSMHVVDAFDKTGEKHCPAA